MWSMISLSILQKYYREWEREKTIDFIDINLVFCPYWKWVRSSYHVNVKKWMRVMFFFENFFTSHWQASSLVFLTDSLFWVQTYMTRFFSLALLSFSPSFQRWINIEIIVNKNFSYSSTNIDSTEKENSNVDRTLFDL